MSAICPTHTFGVVGVNIHSATAKILQHLAVDSDKIPFALRDVHHRKGVESAVVLSTCNRFEIYYWGWAQVAGTALKDFIHHWSGGKISSDDPSIFELSGNPAIRHLFRVSASLDSVAVGECQISGQMKQAVSLSKTYKKHNQKIDFVFRRALTTAKRLRQETLLGTETTSLASLAIRLAKRIFGPLKECRVLLCGLGEIGRAAADILRREQVKQLILCNRTFRKAADLAEIWHVPAVPFEDRKRYLEDADIVLIATAANEYVFNRDDVERALKKRKKGSLFIVDMCLPRNSDPDISKVEHVFIYDMDDFERLTVKNRSIKSQWMKQCDELLEASLAQTTKRLRKWRENEYIKNFRQALETEVLGILEQENVSLSQRQSMAEKLVNHFMKKQASELKNRSDDFSRPTIDAVNLRDLGKDAVKSLQV